MNYIVQINPRALGGYVANVVVAEERGFGSPPLLTPTHDVQATGIGNSPQEALLAAAHQWAGEHHPGLPGGD